MDLHQKTYFLITGASKGIGKTMALECCRKFKEGSVAVLLARSKDGLERTKQEIESLNKAIRVKTYPIDLATATAEEFTKILVDSLGDGVDSVNDFERAFIVHNAGSVGDVSKKASDVPDVKQWMSYYHLNVFSAIALNCAFMKHFGEKVPKLIVNVTSKCGIKPYPSMSFYCSGKAAREMYFSVLAIEESLTTTVVLSYSPGPVDTDMSITVQEETMNEQLKMEFRKLRESKTMLTTEQTTRKFLDVLKQFKFQSGDHIDYYD